MLKVHIETNFISDSIQIYIYEDTPNGRHVAHPVQLVFSRVSEMDIVAPTLELRGASSENFLATFAAAIASVGVKPVADSKLEGKLEATIAHLQDLRTINQDLMGIVKKVKVV